MKEATENQSRRFRPSDRGVMHPVALGILALIFVILAVVFFFIFPVIALALVLIFVGFLTMLLGAVFLPGWLKAVGVIGGIALMALGAIIVIASIGAGTLVL